MASLVHVIAKIVETHSQLSLRWPRVAYDRRSLKLFYSDHMETSLAARNSVVVLSTKEGRIGSNVPQLILSTYALSNRPFLA